VSVAVLSTIALLWLAAVAAPGPNFFIVLRYTALDGHRRGLAAASGIACGAAFWGVAGFFGLQVLFTAAPWLHLALKLAGSAFLIALGLKFVFARASNTLDVPPAIRARSGFFLGLATSIANPQTALSTASLFAATLPPQPSLSLGFAAIGVMTAIAALWYGVLAGLLGTTRAMAFVVRMRRAIERAAGIAFLAFGAKLALER
jgi:threonine/homoserine/homoserine lactone efflux protein